MSKTQNIVISDRNLEIAEKLAEQKKLSEVINDLLFDYSKKMEGAYSKPPTTESKSLSLVDLENMDNEMIDALSIQDIMNSINNRQDIIKYIQIKKTKDKGVTAYMLKATYDGLCRRLAIKLSISAEELDRWLMLGYKEDTPATPEEKV